MTLNTHSRLLAAILLPLLAACGSGSSTSDASAGGSSNSTTGTGSQAGTAAAFTMSCPDGATWQCSGESIVGTDNGIAVTAAGVQVYGKSTNDLLENNPFPGRSIGLMPATGGTAEMRLRKDANATVSSPTVILSNMDITWDGKTDRPIIIETFMTAPGRVEFNANRGLTFRTLPGPNDLTFWDVGIKRFAGTKINYANNSYFPRATPSRCPADLIPCPTIESTGPRTEAGDWRVGGIEPDTTVAGRLHEDGDTFAGNGPLDANGNPTRIAESTGDGVPFPGSKGYRSLNNWSLRYANMAHWTTQDTVKILEWGGDIEHNKGRQGVMAFGDVTAPGSIPTSGTATYQGLAYGWYTPNPAQDPIVFRAAVTLVADFATRRTTINVTNTVHYDAALAALPLAFTASMGAGAVNAANYQTGAVSNAALSGGVSARWFGPVSNGAPPEVGGVIRMVNAGNGAIALGSFVAQRR